MNKQDAKLMLIANGLKPFKGKYSTLSFSYPYDMNHKIKHLRNVYGWGGLAEIIDVIVSRIDNKNYTLTTYDTASTTDVKVKLYSHKQYRFNSMNLSQSSFKKLKVVAAYNGVTASAIVRSIINSVYEGTK